MISQLYGAQYVVAKGFRFRDVEVIAATVEEGVARTELATRTSSTSPKSGRLERLDSGRENSGALKSRTARNKVRRSSSCSSRSKAQVGNPTVGHFGPKQT